MALSKRDVEDFYPLSPLQQGMLFHTLEAPQSGVYSEQVSCRLEGELDEAALERAWRRAMERHPVLRTGFVWQGVREPVQVVYRRLATPFATLDWRRLPEAEARRRLEELLVEDQRRGFDLARAPLLRLTLVRTRQADRLVWGFHHILLDGWSVPLLLAEVRSLYEAARAGRELEMPPPRPYRDFIAWLRRRDRAAAERYWRRALAGFDEPTEPRLAAPETGRGGTAEKQVLLSPEASAAIEGFARRHRLTLNTLVQGAWSVLLSRYSGRRDVLFGTTVSGRPPEIEGIEAMVGLFINTLPVRRRLPEKAPVAAWLADFQQQLAELRRFEATSLLDVQGWSETGPGRPLFENLLVFENYPVSTSAGTEGSLGIEDVRYRERTSYPLTVVAGKAPELLLRVVYHRRRFGDTAAGRMLGHLVRALEGLTRERLLAEVALLGRAERHQLVREWGSRSRPAPGRTLHRLFADQAAVRPDAVALVLPADPRPTGAPDRRLSYGELRARARGLAAELRRRGVGPEARVGLCLERSLETVVAILAVHEAGGAYVPLDPEYPEERLAFLLADSRVALLLTRGASRARLPEVAPLPVLDLDLFEAPAADRGGAPENAGPENLAYVIYTSGSTGRPKGVLIPHSNVVRLLEATEPWFRFGPGDVWTLCHSYAFDFSVWELWGALAYGGRLVVVPRSVSRSPADLSALLERERVTVLNQTPSAFYQLLAGEEETGVTVGPALGRVIFGGEALSPALLAPWFERAGRGGELVNMYGITETTVHVTYRPLRAADAAVRASPVGRAIPDLEVHLLDSGLRPVPQEVTGEVHVGGAGLARGYLDRPALTAERFVPHPASASPGRRLYRTGDEARHRPGGDLEFLGRLDRQVQVRGFRVELGEVESALCEHERLREAVVVARSSGEAASGVQLVAYVVPERGSGATAGRPPVADAELREFLRERLPEHMVPSHLVVLDELPLTAHGKLDRAALPEPERKEAAVTAPATPLEELLAEILAEVLGLERVGTDDSFFDLGGHSLLATRAVSRIRRVLGREVALHTLFEAPTAAALARALEREERPAAPPLARRPRTGEVPLSFSQERLWFLDRLDPGNPVYNLSFAVRLEGGLEPERLRRGLSRAVARHEALRTTFAEVDGRPIQVIAPAGELPLPRIDLSASGRPEDAARELSLREAQTPFDLAAGPLARGRLLVLGPRSHVLLLSLHHTVADAWSMSVLVAEVAEVYRNAEAALPELPVQYADFALWQREWLAGDELERRLEFWRRRLADRPAGLELPTDRPRPALQRFRGGQLGLALPAELSARLAELGRRSGATLFMTLLAAYQTLLSRSAGQVDLLIGVPVAGRHHAELEGLVGFFVNTLALRGDLAGDPPFRELLGRVRAATLEAFAHQDLPFARLVEALQPERDLSHQPLFQVAFALQNTPPIRFELPGVDWRPFDVASPVSRFDLTVSWQKTPEGLAAAVEYDTDLFDATTVARLLRRLRRLLEGVGADADQPLSRLPALDDAERQQLLRENNDTATAYPGAVPLHRLVEARARRHPDAVAVVFDGDGTPRQLTFRELDRRARCLAARLSALGAGPGSRVGVALARSTELVVALLGTLSAGAAYVPLDPEYPDQRLRFMARDAGVSVLLTREGPKPEGAAAPAVDVDPEELAYVIYTSGSTGRPKGVMVPHRGIVNRLLGMQEAYGLTAADRVLQKTPTSFDVSGWEFFWPLVAGARLVLARPGGHRDAAYLARLVARHGITTLHFVPSMLQAFLEVPDAEDCCATLARVITSGEALSPELARRFDERFGAELHNLYGPTEASIDVAAWRYRSGSRTVPIGRSVTNTALHVLDRHLAPVPLGVAGQLHIGGAQLARGYLGRPALTAEKFVPDPFGERPGRLYQTGDLARRRPAGEIEFLGRCDHQVKIRGFRIEPGEVESALARHPAVAACAVVARDARLVAYVVPEAKAVPAARRWLELAPPLPLYELPNGWSVAHLNRGETEFLYREVVAEATYFRHGITVRDGDVVFDVGANIGLFSLFAASRAPGSRFYAVEPIPRIAEALRANLEAHGLDAEVLECALASRPGRAELTFYPHVSLISGRFADGEADREAVRTFLGRDGEAARLAPEEVEELLDERLEAERVSCPLATLSQVMAERGVERIDLLKVDVEKSELEVLAGIDEADWPGVRQVVVEVHDVEGRLARVRELLESHGFRVAVEQDAMLSGGGLYNLYARRPGDRAAEAVRREAPSWPGPQRLAAELREYLRERLPEHLVPAALVPLSDLPRTLNGKLDRAALPAPNPAGSGRTAPRGPEETALAEIWKDLLGAGQVAVEDSFFDLGGHSLAATRMLARVRRDLAVEVSLRRFFEQPTLGGLAREVAARRPGPAPRTAGDVIHVERAMTAEVPLSFGQERLWFFDRLEGANAAYNVPLPVVLRGRSRPAVLAAALTEVVRRHEVLRTTFEEAGGRPRGVVSAAGKVELPVVDLGGLPSSEVRGEARRLARGEAGRPFDLARGPLLRAALVRLEDESHLLLLTLHHAVADAWSMGLLLRELTVLYDAGRRGAPSPLAELPVQYADFAHWQRRRADLEEQLAWWREYLAGAPSTSGIPSDRPRPATPTFRGAQCGRPLPRGLTRRLEELGRRSGATLFMTLLAACETLTYRYGGQPDQVVGTPIANRSRPELEELIGFFVNTLVLRADLTGKPTFDELLKRVRDSALAAYARQDLPFERLVAELDPRRDLAKNPLFEVMFVFQDAAPRATRLAELAVEPFAAESGTAKFDLTLGFAPGPHTLEASAEYGTDLFDATTVARLLGHLVTLLSAVVEDPRRPLADLPLLTPAERSHTLREWNAEPMPADAPALAHRLVEARMERSPDTIALLHEGRHDSYRRLERDSAALAASLQELGVGPDVPVALCLERSPEMVMALTAVLRAGGACLPLDPTYPEERLRFMLSDSGAGVLLTSAGVGERLARHHHHVLRLGSSAAGGPGAENGARLHLQGAKRSSTARRPRGSRAAPENTAYLVYTSGSTGKPKAVAMPHRVLANLMRWQEEVSTPGGPLRTPQFAALSFDVAFQEIFSTLHAGGTLLVPREETRRDPEAMLGLLARERGERLFLPFLALRQLAAAAAGRRRLPPGLRHVIAAGEALQVTPAVAELFRRLPGAVLHNHYGPSETHAASGHTLRGPAGRWPARPAIGRPLTGTALYFLDGAGQPLPAGVPGELAIGGTTVSRGYLRRPGLTAGRFVPDPFGARPGQRLYLSGDLARRLTDGVVVFMGRLDDQVKVRGYRVEVGEVEAALARHPEVREAVVDVADREDPDRRRLVAYVMARSGAAAPSAKALRELLRESLPEHMVPAEFLSPESFPMTPSGKVDRRALLRQEARRLDSGSPYAAPATPWEQRLARLWADVLGRERLGAHDDFFDLGGHSLLAVQLVSRMRDVLGVELPLRKLFEAPTVAAVAARIAREETVPAETVSAMPPVVPVDRDGELPLSFSQERLWFLDQLEPGSPAYNLPTAVSLRGDLDVAAFAAALGTIACRHEALRTTFESVAGRPRQVIHPAPADPRRALPLPVADLTALGRAARPEAERQVAKDAVAPFDLGRGPLVRARMLRVARREWVFVLHFHHVVSDGWSMEVMARELAALYTAFTEGRPSPLPELPVQYADYAHRQREWLDGDGEGLAAQLAWWRERLADDPAPLELPAPRPRPVAQTYRGATIVRVLPRESTAELRALGRREGATLFMTLLAGLKALLARYTGQSDVLVGAPAAGRNRSEVEGLIGYFLNTLVLRTDLGGDPGFRELLRRVRASAVGAYQHQDVPFEKLLEELRPARDTSRTPYFQVLFTMLDFGGTQGLAPELPGLSVEPVPLPEPGAKFDLTLYAGEAEEGLELRLVYNRDLFEPEQAAQLLEHLEAVLAAAVADPDVCLSDLPLRRPGAVPPPVAVGAETGLSIPERFLRAVERHGGEVAVATERFRWTYDELAGHAAAVHRALGTRRDERVALLFEHDAPMTAALLGVLASGAAYVPLDPGSPRERLAAVVEDARPAALLADAANRALAEDLCGAELPLVAFDGLGAEAPGRLAPVSLAPDAVAYLLYTSGSTGRPKGVVQSHRNVLHHAGTYGEVLGLGPGDRLSLFSSYVFDASVMDVYGALLTGAALLPKNVRREGVEGLGAWVSERRITLWHSTPTLYRALMADLSGDEDFSRLRWIVLGGEEVRRRDFELFRRHFPGHVRLVNGLGPTESTLGLQYFADRDAEMTRETLPVGVPVKETEARLVNETGEQAALYGVGEIVLGSPYLALGYWQRPEETRAAFAGDGEARTYRTGDLGRLLPGGVLEFAGRRDQQVKIRGHRVEPGEVESVLARHPAVAQAAVTARSDGGGEARLAAYVVGSEIRLAELREYLATKLPGYMIPAAFVAVDELPLTVTGKVDRRRLPEPPAAGPDPEAPRVAPRTEVERRVAEAWQEVLGLEEIGVDDDFFALGGHSLLATRVIARLRRRYGVELPLRTLFEQPTPARLAEAIEAARRPATDAAPRLCPLPRAERRVWRSRLGAGVAPDDDEEVVVFPVSFSQQRFWFLEQLDPGQPAYLVPRAVRFTGELSAACLAAALAAVIERHEVLRTGIETVDGEPLQVVRETVEAPLPVVDLTALSPPAREAAAGRLAAAEARRPFAVDRPPLLRATLARLAEREHFLVLVCHHLVTDAWTTGILVREVGALYRAAAAGEASPLAPLPLQYGDFAHWQRESCAGEALTRLAGYWRRRLADLPVTELPFDRPPGVLPRGRGRASTLLLEPSLADGLAAAGRRRGATPFMVLLAGLALLVRRHGRQDDLAVGSPVAGREQPELEGLVGFFVNTLVLRLDLAGEPTFAELLVRVRRDVLEDYEHQQLPFEKLVEEVAPERHLETTPLFQVAFSMLHAPPGEARLPGLDLQSVDLEERAVQFALTLFAREGEHGLALSLEYDTALFDAATARRLTSHFSRLLEAAARAPDQPAHELPMLAPAEVHQLLTEYGDAEAPGDTELLAERFAMWAGAAPDAVALSFADGPDAVGRHLGYGELARRVERSAARLAAEGVGPEVRVGVCLERSPELVVALLAVERAGGAYVPLDPRYPSRHRDFLLADAGIRVLVSSPERVPDLKLPPQVRVVTTEDAEAHETELREGRLPRRADPRNLAYVIYTSGSTGRPKGVGVTHGNAARLFTAAAPRTTLGSRQTWTLFHSYAFDFSVWELWGALAHGGRLVIVPYLVSRSPEDFWRLLCRERVTVLNQTPSAFRQLARAATADESALEHVIFGGEALEPAALDAWRERRPRLINMYGITETTVHVTWHPVKRAGTAPSGAAPSGMRASLIGRPLSDLEVHVLERGLRPAPLGVAGELTVGGAGLARGYLGRPALTAGRFVADPFARRPGRRLYRSGDRGRRRHDGGLEYLGRIDQQVKLRGFRIEPGEVEAVLAAHPAIEEAMVTVRESAAGEARLAACAVPGERHAGPLRRLLRLQAEGRLSRDAVCELPDGTAVAHLNRSETEFLYREIFEQERYLGGGLTLEPGAVVFDVGANVGLFTLFAARRAPGAVIYAFEPIPPVFERLAANAEIHGLDVRTFPCGLAARAGRGEFTYYPHVSVISGRFAAEEEEKAVVRTFLLGREDGAGLRPEQVDELLAERLRGERVSCPLRTVSEILREHAVETVDLLKVDVEKSELDVLQGIAEQDWPKIRQVAVEVHDVEGRLEELRSLLTSRGYLVTVEQDPSLAGTGLYDLFARRGDARRGDARRGDARSAPRAVTPPSMAAWSSPARLAGDLRRWLRERLPEHMVPATFTFLERFPRTPQGKLDRRALAALQPEEAVPATATAPRDELERALVEIWEEVLERRPVGVSDSFFDLGGHSLLAVRLMSAIRRRLGHDLPLATLFRSPTVEALAQRLASRTTGAPASPLVLLSPDAHDGWGPPLFLVHPAGGNVLCYRDLAAALPRKVYGLQALAPDGRQEPADRVEEMAERFLEAIRGVQAEGPYHLGGWSFGGLVAYEMASRLVSRGEEVAALILLDVRADVAGDGRVKEEKTLLREAFSELGCTPPRQDLTTDELLASLVGEARTLAADFTVDDARRYLRIYGASERARAHYRPPLYPGRVTLFRAAERGPGPAVDETLGWSGLAVDVEVRPAAGRHEDMLYGPRAEGLAKEIRTCLEARMSIGEEERREHGTFAPRPA